MHRSVGRRMRQPAPCRSDRPFMSAVATALLLRAHRLAVPLPQRPGLGLAVGPVAERCSDPYGEHTGSAEPRGDEAPPPALAAAAASASAPMGRIKPLLSEEDRQAARQQAAVLRGTPINEAPPAAAAPRPAHTANMADAAPVYAVVTRARRQHQSAAQDLALLRSVAKRLSGPLPVHGELMQNQGEWRAAWWPFTNLADAERARVLLAGRGLKAEVVAF